MDNTTVTLSPDQLEELKEVFSLYDIDSNGTISALELAHVMRSVGQDLTEAELYEAIDEFDASGDREIDLNEFLAMMSPKMQEVESPESLMQAFKIIDRDNDGFLTAADLRHMLSTMGKDPSDEDVHILLTEIDTNGDSRISWREFLTFMHTPI